METVGDVFEYLPSNTWRTKKEKSEVLSERNRYIVQMKEDQKSSIIRTQCLRISACEFSNQRSSDYVWTFYKQIML